MVRGAARRHTNVGEADVVAAEDAIDPHPGSLRRKGVAETESDVGKRVGHPGKVSSDRAQSGKIGVPCDDERRHVAPRRSDGGRNLTLPLRDVAARLAIAEESVPRRVWVHVEDAQRAAGRVDDVLDEHRRRPVR